MSSNRIKISDKALYTGYLTDRAPTYIEVWKGPQYYYLVSNDRRFSGANDPDVLRLSGKKYSYTVVNIDSHIHSEELILDSTGYTKILRKASLLTVKID